MNELFMLRCTNRILNRDPCSSSSSMGAATIVVADTRTSLPALAHMVRTPPTLAAARHTLD